MVWKKGKKTTKPVQETAVKKTERPEKQANETASKKAGKTVRSTSGKKELIEQMSREHPAEVAAILRTMLNKKHL